MGTLTATKEKVKEIKETGYRKPKVTDLGKIKPIIVASSTSPM